MTHAAAGMPFVKMHGLGNDFVVLDARRAPLTVGPAAARAIADRRTGVGYDQLLILREAEDGGDVYMQILNADGSEAGACGNGTRCVAALVMAQTGADRLIVETRSGFLAARARSDGQVSVDMGPAMLEWQQVPLVRSLDTLHLPLAAGPLEDAVGTGMGNPHATFFVADAAEVPLDQLGERLEHDPLFPDRANIGVASLAGPDRLRLRVWERGVGLTRACGSGACAAAVAASRRGLTGRQVAVELDGGRLDIDWRDDGRVLMTGAGGLQLLRRSGPLVAAGGRSTVSDADSPRKGGWLSRLRSGLSRSSAKLTEGISQIFGQRKLDEAMLEELEELLIGADLGVATATKVTGRLRDTRLGQAVSADEVRRALADEIALLIDPVATPLPLNRSLRPQVVLVVGVNGSGKTTTIGKLAKYYSDGGLDVMLAAGDTFRAAAVEQLKIWGDRVGCPVISRPEGADAAGLAFDALTEARARAADLLLIDTAGRLHNKSDLMAELQKVVRVMRKVDPSAPHTVLLVLDATTGQNALTQVEIFRDVVGVNGLIMTKLDGTARGGVVVALAEKFAMPVHMIGVGETAEDLRPFEADAFARSLLGLPAP